MKPYSLVKAIIGSCYIYFSIFRELGQFKQIGPKYSKSCAHRKSKKVAEKVKLQISHQMKPYSNVKIIYICFSVFWALGVSPRNWTQILQIMSLNIKKVIQRVNILISHQDLLK